MRPAGMGTRRSSVATGMTAFGLTWDYRCPFARIVHEHVLDGLEEGADWDVTFIPFSLGQVHVGEGEPDIWDRPGDDSGLFALQAGVVVRDRFPDRFRAVHRALFDARHDEGLNLRDEAAVIDVIAGQGVNGRDVLDQIATGEPLQTVREEHTEVAKRAEVWGVPTFVLDDEGVFVRLMERSAGDGGLAIERIETILDLSYDFDSLNELKHTRVKR